MDVAGGKSKTDEAPKPKPRGRPKREVTSAAKAAELQARIKENLDELANYLDADRSQPPPETLAEIIRDDADRIAEVIAANAQRFAFVEKIALKVFGKAGPLSALRAFGPMIRSLAGAALEKRADLIERAEAEERARAEQAERDGDGLAVEPLAPPVV